MDNTERLRNAITPALLAVATAVPVAVAQAAPATSSILVLPVLLWPLVAVVAGTRPLWDADFFTGQRFGQRVWTLFWKYYGIIGLVGTILFQVGFAAANRRVNPPTYLHSNSFLIGLAILGIVMLVIPLTSVRQIGAGLLVGLALISWLLVLMLLAAAVPALIVYGITAVLSWSVATRRAQATAIPSAWHRGHGIAVHTIPGSAVRIGRE